MIRAERRSRVEDDLSQWTNYTPVASPAEAERVHEIVGNAARADAFLAFGLRPVSVLDWNPSYSAADPGKPFVVTTEAMSLQKILVDVSTGCCFRASPNSGDLVFDMVASNNVSDALELRQRASTTASPFTFERSMVPTCLGDIPRVIPAPRVHPLTVRVSSRGELTARLEELRRLFCDECRATRLWLRGQCEEYFLKRPEALTQQLYGTPREASLLPSAGRFAIAHPDQMGFGFAFAGANHFWKKPFLIWIMRENAAWFSRDRRALDLVDTALREDDDASFVRILNALQYNSELAGLPRDIRWPEEADDLRQWFFAHMKPHSFGVTLQQYGYITSLLDLTEDLEVAIYFAQAAIVDKKMRKRPPKAGRLIYVFAERSSGDFFRRGPDLFWGDTDWAKRIPPRLDNQKAGFLMGSTCRAQNFYANMIVARIFLDDVKIESALTDEDLFPAPEHDLLYQTLIESRPVLEHLY
jgi:hypothetical protein